MSDPETNEVEDFANTIINVIYSGDFQSFRRLINDNNDKVNNFKDNKGWCLCHHVCYCDDINMFSDLLNHVEQSHLSHKTIEGNSLIHISSQQSSLRILRYLLSLHKKSISDDNIDENINSFRINDIVNDQNNWFETPLHIASRVGHYDTIIILIEIGAVRTIRDKWNRTPYEIAVELGYESKILDILYDGTCHNQINNTEVINSADMVPNESRRIVQGNLTKEFMMKLKEKENNTALTEEPIRVRHIYDDHSETLKSDAFSSNQPIPTHQIMKRIAVSKLMEYPGDVEKLSNYLKDLDNYDPAGKDMYGLTALHKFAAWNKVDLLTLLLPSLTNEEINYPDTKSGFTAVHYAVDEQAEQSLRFLLSYKGVQQNTKDKKGRTPLELAKEKGLDFLMTLFES